MQSRVRIPSGVVISLGLLGACNPFEVAEAVEQAEKQQAALAKADRMVASLEGMTNLSELTFNMALMDRSKSDAIESIGPTPPLDACCHDETNTCKPEASNWDHPTWRALDFNPGPSKHFSYSIERTQAGLTLLATADLNCNGTRQTQRVVGTPNGEGWYDFGDPITENEHE